MKMSLDRFYKNLAKLSPGLSLNLQQAGMADSEIAFVKKTIFAASYMSIGFTLIAALFMTKMGVSLTLLIFAFPVLIVALFMYFLKLPYVRILKVEREIDKEIVYAGRFLVIELESGIPVYDAFRQVAVNYPAIGKYFQNVVEDIDLGTPIEDALNNAVELTPSHNFRRMLWQILNSMTTGANVASSLGAVLEQITREQKVELTEYGRKLNPLAMFYMIIAVILPSIGVTMFVILISFLSIQLNLATLLLIAGFMGFVQFLFYTVIKSSRPPMQVE